MKVEEVIKVAVRHDLNGLINPHNKLGEYIIGLIEDYYDKNESDEDQLQAAAGTLESIIEVLESVADGLREEADKQGIPMSDVSKSDLKRGMQAILVGRAVMVERDLE